MESLTPRSTLSTKRILSITAHPDDLEMHQVGLLNAAAESFAYVVTDGGASTVNHTRGSLC